MTVNSLSSAHIPVITIDGPTASGKGTVAQLVADQFNFHYLDSGALYRLTALSALRANADIGNESVISTMAQTLPCRFEDKKILLDNEDVTEEIRKEAIGNLASRIATFPGVRHALAALQLSFCRLPGLVADGRDMGTIIFPNAILKVFLTASVDARATRRYKQLIEKGFPANMVDLRRDIKERDERDEQRSLNPLKPAHDALVLDTTELSIHDAVECIVKWYSAKTTHENSAQS